MKKKDDLIYFGTNKVWKIYPDSKADAIEPKWWYKFMFWKKWKYQEWKIRREYKSLKEMIKEI